MDLFHQKKEKNILICEKNLVERLLIHSPATKPFLRWLQRVPAHFYGTMAKSTHTQVVNLVQARSPQPGQNYLLPCRSTLFHTHGEKYMWEKLDAVYKCLRNHEQRYFTWAFRRAVKYVLYLTDFLSRPSSAFTVIKRIKEFLAIELPHSP